METRIDQFYTSQGKNYVASYERVTVPLAVHNVIGNMLVCRTAH